jgi:hypothetical protein
MGKIGRTVRVYSSNQVFLETQVIEGGDDVDGF